MSTDHTPTARVTYVKDHVKNMRSVISESKGIELTGKFQETACNGIVLGGGGCGSAPPQAAFGSFGASQPSHSFSFGIPNLQKSTLQLQHTQSNAQQIVAPSAAMSQFREQAELQRAVTTARVEMETPASNLSHSNNERDDSNNEQQKGNKESSSNASSTNASAYAEREPL